jgi:hypothetical protein
MGVLFDGIDDLITIGDSDDLDAGAGGATKYSWAFWKPNYLRYK